MEINIPTHTIEIVISGCVVVTQFEIAVIIVIIPDTNDIPFKYFTMPSCFMTSLYCSPYHNITNVSLFVNTKINLSKILQKFPMSPTSSRRSSSSVRQAVVCG